jgi:hypothetical protein
MQRISFGPCSVGSQLLLRLANGLRTCFGGERLWSLSGANPNRTAPSCRKTAPPSLLIALSTLWVIGEFRPLQAGLSYHRLRHGRRQGRQAVGGPYLAVLLFAVKAAQTRSHNRPIAYHGESTWWVVRLLRVPEIERNRYSLEPPHCHVCGLSWRTNFGALLIK